VIDHSLEEWLEFINKNHPLEIELGLERVSVVWSRIKRELGVSKVASFVITVSGTNGKGSTVKCIEEILCISNYSFGSFTSPHIFKFNERIKLNGLAVLDCDIIESFKLIESLKGETKLTYFEFNTLCALIIFSKNNLDFVILEVGLGGRLDAVNIIDADLAILTSIGLDHKEWLGNTRFEIGREKLGIARKGKPLLIGEDDLPEDLNHYISDIGADPYFIDEDFFLSPKSADSTELTITLKEKLHSFGILQHTSVLNINKALAIQALILTGIPIQKNEILKSLNQATLEGRQQSKIHNEINILFDVAHNAEAAEVLAKNIESNGKTYAVVSILGDKDWDSIVDKLDNTFDYWFIGRITDNDRAADPDVLLDVVRCRGLSGKVFESMEMAFQNAYNLATLNDLIVVFGSFSCVASVMKLIEIQP
tara:strand:- start:8 stop:1279 length:1272 start_codon:yes stop_codon:yes gene_type:complete